MTVLKPIIYFSLFDHPITEDEVFRYSEISDRNKLNNDINHLIDQGIIHKVNGFLLFEKNKKHILKRIDGNDYAKSVMPKATQIATFISKFPFIRGVAISGSLSKGFFDKTSDFDFFIITKAKRVWITRTFIAIYKRLFLLNSHKEFCVNYFVSTDTLEIEEKNRFTATEIVTIIPLFGRNVFSEFYNQNKWVYNFFPNISFTKNLMNINPLKTQKITRLIEFLFNNSLGVFINYICMKIISKRWALKYKKKINDPYKSKKEISKHHPENFQKIVIKKLNTKYQSCKKSYGINIPEEHE